MELNHKPLFHLVMLLSIVDSIIWVVLQQLALGVVHPICLTLNAADIFFGVNGGIPPGVHPNVVIDLFSLQQPY